MDDLVQTFLSKYYAYDLEMKLSVCRAAFELSDTCPPWEGPFRLARSVGYKIPEKWNHLYL